MFEKLTISIQLRRTVKAKKTAIKNQKFEIAASFRDTEKALLAKLGVNEQQVKSVKIQHSFLIRCFRKVQFVFQKYKLERELIQINKLELNSIRKLNYNKANRLYDQKLELNKQIEELESE